MDDLRLEYIKELICKCLSVTETESFDELFERDAECVKILYGFITGSKNQRCIFFFKTVEEVEIEIDDVEASKSSNEEEQEKDEEEDANDDKTISAVEDKAENDAEEIVASEQLAEDVDTSSEVDQETEIHKSKYMAQLVQKTVLHMCLNITQYIPDRRYAYLFLKVPGTIPFVETLEAAADLMKNTFEVGLINEHPLFTLLNVLSSVYLPLFNQGKYTLLSSLDYANLENFEIESSQEEFRKIINQFYNSAQSVIDQLKKPFPFALPYIHPSKTPEELSEDCIFVEEAKSLMKECISIIKSLLKTMLSKEPIAKDPFKEINFWTERKSELSSLSDHLSNHQLQQVVKTLKIINYDALSDFDEQCDIVRTQLYTADDNMTYLHNIEPYLRSLKPEYSISSAINIMPSLLNVLKLVWMLSDYYSHAENMGRLIEGLSLSLQYKVKEVVNVKQLFNKNLSEIQEITKECSVLLKEWRYAYQTQCSIMEKYQGLQHWYYSSKILFEKTDYIASVCDDLTYMSQKVDELHNVFLSDVKNVSRETKEFDYLEESLFAILRRIQYIDFDIFLPTHKLLWINLKNWFDEKRVHIEGKIKDLISRTFELDITFESALALIRSFSKIHTSLSIKDFMNEKSADVLNQYLKVVDEVEKEFLLGKEEPPESDVLPELTSAVLWERNLLLKIKKPIIEFRKDEKFFNTKKGHQVQDHYIHVARAFKSYETELFENWKENAVLTIPECLKMNILYKGSSEIIFWNKPYLPVEDVKNMFECTELYKLSYDSNFSEALNEISTEVRYLERFYFEIPQIVANFVLEEDKYFDYVTAMNVILYKLHDSLSSITYPEAVLLEPEFKKTATIIDPGVEHLHWTSFGVLEFLRKMQKAVDCLISYINQVKNIGKNIDTIINSLISVDLIPHDTFTDDCEIPICQVFFKKLENKIENEVKKLVEVYTSVVPQLFKLELLTCHSSTGRAELLKEYYKNCEEKIICVLAEMMIANLHSMEKILLPNCVFPYLKAVLNSKNELIIASIKELNLVFETFLGNFLKSTTLFKRWIDGTCIEAQRISDEAKRYEFEYSYFLDLSMHPKIHELLASIYAKMKDFVFEIRCRYIY